MRDENEHPIPTYEGCRGFKQVYVGGSILKTSELTPCVASALQFWVGIFLCICRDADKSLARPGRKQARKHVRDARDFNNTETRAVIKFLFPARQNAEGNSRHSDRSISLFPSWSS